MSARMLRLLLPALVLAGCSHDNPIATPTPLTAADLAGAQYNLVAKNPSESVILLGSLEFGPVTGDQLAGRWTVREWSGADIPGLPGNGTFTGTMFGGTAVIDLVLPGSNSSLGLIAEGFRNGRLTGSIALLPSRTFEGRFEGIRP